ncbi:hypothetical protein ACFE04_013744 [Oxalis oulophora]
MSHFESIVSNSTSIDDVEHHLTNSESGSYSGTFSSSADDDDSAPFSGQTFPTLESLIAFYQEHAKLNGFSIVKQSYRRNMSGGCSRWKIIIQPVPSDIANPIKSNYRNKHNRNREIDNCRFRNRGSVEAVGWVSGGGG